MSRPVRRNRPYLPDVYVQEPKQKEDELSAETVKNGFTFKYIDLALEHDGFKGTDFKQSEDDILNLFRHILTKKDENNTINDLKKKFPLNTKDNFWPVMAARTQKRFETWMSALASTEPVNKLAKSVPTFLKKEDVFQHLFEHNVALLRAGWYIKMLALYYSSNNDSKQKKRHVPTDPCTEWTKAIIDILKDVFERLIKDNHSQTSISELNTPSAINLDSEQINGPNSVPTTVGSLTPQYGPSTPQMLHSSILSQPSASPTQTPTISVYQNTADKTRRQWDYYNRLLRVLFDQGLLDRQNIVEWVVDTFIDRIKHADDHSLRYVVPIVFQYSSEILEYEIFSRKISYYCCTRIGEVYNDYVASNLTQTTLQTTFSNLMTCPMHRLIIGSLSAIVQCITLRCPAALLYNAPLDEQQKPDTLLKYSSPLDFLPCYPSQLPLPAGIDQSETKQMLTQAEDDLRARSLAIEHKWSTDKLQSVSGQAISRVLYVLEVLDEFKEERYLLENVYSKIYPNSASKELLTPELETAIVHLMCDWAITTCRAGVYRAFFVARLLEKRQAEKKLISQQQLINTSDEKESDYLNSSTLVTNPFQSALTEYLLKQAPTLNGNNDADISFATLVMLFSELIRLNIFSSKQFMCSIVSHGLVSLIDHQDENQQQNHQQQQHHHHLPTKTFPLAPPPPPLSSSFHPSQPQLSHFVPANNNSLLAKSMSYNSVKSEPEDHKPDIMSVLQRRTSQSTVLDLDQMDNNHTNTDYSTTRQKPANRLNINANPNNDSTPSSDNNILKYRRYQLFLEQFPFPLDDDFRDDFNQRKIILYGISLKRDDAHKQLKANVRQLSSMFRLKNCIDTSSCVPPFTRSIPYAKYYQIKTSLLQLSYHDQYYITNRVSKLLLERITAYIERQTRRLPWLDDIAFLFELMEKTLNLYGLIQTCVELLKIFSRIESMHAVKASPGISNYVAELYLEITSVFRFYTPILILTPANMIQVFENLITICGKIVDPQRTTSVERALLMLMHDFYSSCPYLKSKYSEKVQQTITLIKKELYAQNTQNNKQDPHANFKWDPNFFMKIIESPRSASNEIQIDRTYAKQLDESSQARCNFVINTIIAVANSSSLTYIHDMGHLATELTCQVASLNSVWLLAIKALSSCTNVNRPPGTANIYSVFDELNKRVDTNDLYVHNNLSVFISIMIARHAFSINEYIIVAVQSVISSSPKTNGEQENEPGTRFTCHVLEHLFSANHNPWQMMIASRERRLLASNYRLIAFGAFLCVLKSLLILNQASFKDSKKYLDLCKDKALKHKEQNKFDNKDINSQFQNYFRPCRDPYPEELSDMALRVLNSCCDQDWIQERCLKESDTLCNQTNLCDKLLEEGQAQQLLRLICYKSNNELRQLSFDKGTKNIISSLLLNLNQWTLRSTILELKLMLKQLEYREPKQTEHSNHLLQSIASATIELFQHQTEGKYTVNNLTNNNTSTPILFDRKGIWLIAPLISRLPNNVQGKILQLAGSVLENGNSMLNSTKSKADKENQVLRSISLLSHQPFLSLVLSCLKDQDSQRVGLLDSLRGQLEQLYKQAPIVQDDPNMKAIIFESLQLRLSLIGGMFETIVRNHNSSSEWISVLSQLIASGVIDTKNNEKLLNTVLDMLGVLIHSLIPAEGSIESSRVYINLVRKVRKDLGERTSEALDEVKRFLPLQKTSFEVYVVEPFDAVSNRLVNQEMKKHGLQVARKEKVISWEAIEGVKTPTAICYSWFCARKTERKRLRYEEQYRLLLRHKHICFDRALGYFKNPPDVPAETFENDLEIVENKQVTIDITQKYHQQQQQQQQQQLQGRQTSVDVKKRGGAAGTGTTRKNSRSRTARAPSVIPQNPPYPSAPTPTVGAGYRNPQEPYAWYNGQPPNMMTMQPGQPNIVPTYGQSTMPPKTVMPSSRMAMNRPPYVQPTMNEQQMNPILMPPVARQISSKRKLDQSSMFTNEAYGTPPKMQMSSGKLLREKRAGQHQNPMMVPERTMMQGNYNPKMYAQAAQMPSNQYINQQMVSNQTNMMPQGYNTNTMMQQQQQNPYGRATMQQSGNVPVGSSMNNQMMGGGQVWQNQVQNQVQQQQTVVANAATAAIYSRQQTYPNNMQQNQMGSVQIAQQQQQQQAAQNQQAQQQYYRTTNTFPN